MSSPEMPTSSDSPRPEGGRPRKPRYRAVVKKVEPLTPHMVRVTFTGEALGAFAWNGPAAHIKLIFAPDGQGEAAGPSSDAPRPTMRTYTPRRFDPDARELDVEFVIHGEGPASTWAAQAAVGQSLLIAGPGRSYAIDAQAPWYLLAGDDSAIPAISTILEALPASTEAHVYIEAIDAGEERPLATLAKAKITWLKRGPDPSRAGRELEAAIRHVGLPEGHGRIYVACEAGAMRRIRHHLLHERGVDRSRLVTRGYWRLGETDHPDSDYGEDVS